MTWEGSAAPGSFVNPSLPLYLMMPVLSLQARAADARLLRGVLADPLMAGRALSALAGAAAVLLLGLAAAGTLPGFRLLPPLLLALSPGFVNLCHFATPEAWLMLGTSATLLLAIEHARGRAPAWALGLALGLTLSTKYTAAALFAPAMLAVSMRDTPRRGRGSLLPGLIVALIGIVAGAALLTGAGAELGARLRLKDPRLLEAPHALDFIRAAGAVLLGSGMVLAAGVAVARAGWRPAMRLVRPELPVVIATAAAGFFAGTPYALVRPVSFLSDLAFNFQTRAEYKGLVATGTSYVGYLALLDQALTGPMLGAAAVGVVFALARALRGDRAAVIFLLGGIAPYLLVASSGHQALRFLAPALPAAAWLASVCPTVLPSPRMGRLVTILIVARVALGALLVLRLFQVDSRALAGRWMQEHIPMGAAVDVITNHPGYAPAVPAGRSERIVPTLSREMAPPDRFRQAAARYPIEASPWLVLTASYYERFLDHPEQAPEKAEFFHALLEGRGGFEVVARFQQKRWLRPEAEFLDPEIVILRKREEHASP